MKCTCIVCRGELENLSGCGLQPSGGVAFSSPGHYGSTLFDPMDGTALEIVVCDGCLKNAGIEEAVAHEGRVWTPAPTA